MSFLTRPPERPQRQPGDDRDVLFIEGGRDLTYGASLLLDPINLAKKLDAELICVISGENDKVIDQVHFLKDYLNTKDIDFRGVVINTAEKTYNRPVYIP